MKAYSIELSEEDAKLLKDISDGHINTDAEIRDALQRHIDRLIGDLRGGKDVT